MIARLRASLRCPRWILRPCLLAMSLLVLAPAFAASRSEVLLVVDSAQALSVLDGRGVAEALSEQQTPWIEFARSADHPLTAEVLQPFAVLVLAHTTLDGDELAAVDDWVRRGGGLLASGAAGLGLEPTLGLGPLQSVERSRHSEIRFVAAHAVATGHYWNGPITQLPPMPVAQLPAIMQLLYLDPAWPAFTANATAAEVLARWRDSSASWLSMDAEPAVFAHQAGLGRTLYIGALAGAYADSAWRYPLTWRTLIDQALAWVNTRGSVIQLGYWPDGHRAALTLSADSERAAMATVVPQLLAMFQRLGLQRFATFFMVGQAGGDPLTEGALENPQTVAAIVQAGSELAGHGDVHSRFAGQTLATQIERLTGMRALIEPGLGGSGEQLLGFRAPGLAVDRNTFQALVQVGLVYDSSEQDVWNEWTLPYFNAGLWHLPLSSPMDYALLHEAGLSGTEWEALSRDKLDFVRSRRGMFNWVIHPWLIAEQLPRIERVLADTIARGDVWLRRMDDLLYWWMQREDLRITLLQSDAFGLSLRVDNLADADVHGATIWLRKPLASAARQLSVDAVAVDPLRRQHGLDATEFEVVVLPTIAARGSVILQWSELRSPQLFADGFEE